MLVPVFVLLGGMAFWPLFRTFDMSLHADALTGSSYVGDFLGFQNYVNLITGELSVWLIRPFFSLDSLFQSAIPVTFIFTVGVVLTETVLGLAMALLLNRNFKFRGWFRMVFILPWAVPLAIQGLIFYLMFASGVGFATPILQDLGVFSNTPLASSREALMVVMISDIWKQTPFMALLILAGLQSIDRSLYSVAKISGASVWERFKTITLPLVLPSLLVAMLFRTIGALKIFGPILVISNCSTVPSLSCLVVSAFNSRLYGTSSTLAFVMALIVGMFLLVYLVLYRRYNIGGIS
ncbi:MAG: carbohydrate ABC transporter permease [Halobacteriales archaeon]